MNTEEKKKEEQSEVEKASRMRRLIIETDGNRLRIVTNETTGLLELKAILTELLTNLR